MSNKSNRFNQGRGEPENANRVFGTNLPFNTEIKKRSSSIIRWTHEPRDDLSTFRVKTDPEGNWVKYTDVKPLLERIKELETIIKKLEDK